ncbi:MAG: shikimate kinase [Chloroflexota bacterium]|jgi:shikimate kinase
MNIVLIGLSGSGKSSVGRLLATQLGWEFFDTDADVERTAGRRIHEIFSAEGEATFRRFEAEAVKRALGGRKRVVAVGGGAIMDPINRQEISRGNVVVLLEANIDTLISRLTKDAADEPRPLLASGDPRTRLLALMAARDPIYRSIAGIVVDTEGLDIEQVTASIAGKLRSCCDIEW